MTDRAAQLRAASAKVRKAKRAAGLCPHEVWCTPIEWIAKVKPLLDDLAGRRK